MASKLIEESYKNLFPNREFTFVSKIRYSGRFKGYNGNIVLKRDELVVSLSRNWKGVSRDIQKGIIQDLLAKLFKVKIKTLEIDLYHSFLKNVHHTIPKTESHPVLAESFERMNEEFFLGLMDMPNLVIGQGTTKLGTYDYGMDTISISELVLQDRELVDYVMYHEMLHKKHKFVKGRHHTKAFRNDERKFGDIPELDRRLAKLIRKKRSWWNFN